MKPKIRYSLRAFLLVFTVLAIWLGIRTNAAIKQRRTVAAIRDAGGYVYFNWQMKPVYDAQGDLTHFDILKDTNAISAPAWLRNMIGDDFFQYVVKLGIHPEDVNDEIITAMGRLPRLKDIALDWEQLDPDAFPKMTQEELDELKERIGQQCPKASVWSPGL